MLPVFLLYRCSSIIRIFQNVRVDLPFGHRANLTSLDGYPYGLASVFGLHDFLLQFVKPLTAVEHLADLSVLAYEDTTFGIF